MCTPKRSQQKRTVKSRKPQPTPSFPNHRCLQNRPQVSIVPSPSPPPPGQCSSARSGEAGLGDDPVIAVAQHAELAATDFAFALPRGLQNEKEPGSPSCDRFFPSTLPQKPATVTEKNSNLAIHPLYPKTPSLKIPAWIAKLRSLFSVTVAIGFWGKVHGHKTQLCYLGKKRRESRREGVAVQNFGPSPCFGCPGFPQAPIGVGF